MLKACLVTVKPDGDIEVWLVGANQDLLNTVGADCAQRFPDHITFIWAAEEVEE